MRCDYKSVSPRQRRRAVRRHGLLVITLILVGLFGGLLAYIKGDRPRGTLVAATPHPAPVTPAPVTPVPVTSPARAVVAPLPAAPESFKPKYDFYTELPKRQVFIQ